MSRCASCKWWQSEKSSEGRSYAFGRCHLNPPENKTMSFQTPGGIIRQPVTAWPQTKPDDFCGQWEAAE